ncbi:glycosyl hydrolase family 18 protein [Lipingzhangella sp. LS1_29]|uniref:chitinase n=1 Tax=Lipingzhangella rawalii TaxID=2055835 RepID=A0ABU2H5A9_9ACTN|nr:glycosyl hydrolase family 18 protein [Lipingzhangella rawalii]MDS1270494.1 glycosyl hydrolase family 18 protein [Lipingzhangella rawalii]
MRRVPLQRWAYGATGALLALALAPLTAPTDPAAADSADVTVVYTQGATWDTGYSADFTIHNNDDSPLSDWTLEFALPEGASVGSLWNAQLSGPDGPDDTYTVTPPSWGGDVPADGSYTIGFNGQYDGGETDPTHCAINSLPCDGDNGDVDPPSTPDNVTVTDTTSTSISLAWDASSTELDIATYEVLLDGEVVRSVDGDTTNATVADLDPETSYTFTVRAVDIAGNTSAASDPVTAETDESNGTDPGPDPEHDELRVGYFTQWGIYDRDYLVRDMHTSGTAEDLTHVNYAFANINEDGQCFQANQLGEGDAWADYGRSFDASESVDGEADTWDQDLRGNFNQLRKLKEMHPDLRVNLSIGGWTWSEHISDAALTPESREQMAASCIDMFLRGNLPSFDGAGGQGAAAGVFDGIDLDWEWPGSEGHPHNTVRPEDKENFTALVQEFRDQLDDLEDEKGQTYDLTAFVPADPEKVEAGYEVPQLMEDFDFITVQGYDYKGAWEAEGPTNHQSNIVETPGDPGPEIFSSEIAIQEYLDRGADPEDLVMGVPFYGRGWQGVDPGPDGDGLFQPATGPAPGEYEDGINDWKLLTEYLDQGDYELYRDEERGVAWIYNGDEWWTYDDPVAMEQKVDWVNEQELGGVMIWSLDGDDADGTLMSTIDQTLTSG